MEPSSARPVAVYDKIKAEAFIDLLNFTNVIECFLTIELNLIYKSKWKNPNYLKT